MHLLFFQLTMRRLLRFFDKQTSSRFCRKGRRTSTGTIHSGIYTHTNPGNVFTKQSVSVRNHNYSYLSRSNIKYKWSHQHLFQCNIAVTLGRRCNSYAQMEGQDWPGCQVMLILSCYSGETCFLPSLPDIWYLISLLFFSTALAGVSFFLSISFTRLIVSTVYHLLLFTSWLCPLCISFFFLF